MLSGSRRRVSACDPICAACLKDGCSNGFKNLLVGAVGTTHATWRTGRLIIQYLLKLKTHVHCNHPIRRTMPRKGGCKNCWSFFYWTLVASLWDALVVRLIVRRIGCFLCIIKNGVPFTGPCRRRHYMTPPSLREIAARDRVNRAQFGLRRRLALIAAARQFSRPPR